MDSLREIFLAEVEAFLSVTGMAPGTLGRKALSDGEFVADLRSTDRAPSTRTIERVRRFMADQAAAKRREADQLEEIISGNSPRAA